MYTLYWSPDTGAFAVQAVLEELGAAYRGELVDTGKGQHRAPAFLALNPMGQVPALRLPDGTVISESAAMLQHLCDAHAAAGLLPPPGSSARAQADRWLFWLATAVYEADLRYYYPERYTGDAGGAAGVRAAAVAQMDRMAALADAQLVPGPYALGAQFGAVDIYLFMLVLWHPARTEIHARHPRLGALMRIVRARPSIERIWAQHFPPGGGGPWSTWTGSSAS